LSRHFRSGKSARNVNLSKTTSPHACTRQGRVAGYRYPPDRRSCSASVCCSRSQLREIEQGRGQ
jgi:hypothetical protein